MTTIQRIAAFTDHGTGGNPAGVLIGDVLPDAEEMQRIAAEVGLSETAFAAPEGAGWKTRYFSPETEVPFCGHATIALGAGLARTKGPGRFRLFLANGEIEVEAGEENGRGHSVLRSLPTHNEAVSDAVIEEALALFGYSRNDLDTSLSPRRMNAGAEHLFIPLNSRERLSTMRYDLEAGREIMRRHRFVTVAFVCRETNELFYARNAFASGGVLEDPATGAAAAALAGMLRDTGILTDGEITVLQGSDMGRPSRLQVRYGTEVGAPVFVSGETVAM